MKYRRTCKCLAWEMPSQGTWETPVKWSLGKAGGGEGRIFTRSMKVVLSGKLHQVHIGREDEGDRQKDRQGGALGRHPQKQAGEKWEGWRGAVPVWGRWLKARKEEW